MKQKLLKDENIYILIPESMIKNKDFGNLRIALYSYLWVRRGMDRIVYFSINDFLETLQFNITKIRTYENNPQERVIKLLLDFREIGLLEFDDKIFTHSVRQGLYGRILKIKFDELDISERFCVIYWDEILQLINHNDEDCKKSFTNNAEILVVFAWIRLNIGQRKRNRESDTWIEAWGGYFTQIYNDTGISKKKIPKFVKLMKDVGLIHYVRERAKKIQADKYCTGVFIISNTYMRQNGEIVDMGEKYYLKEEEKERKDLKQGGVIKR